MWNSAVPCLARRERSVEAALLSMRHEHTQGGTIRDILSCVDALVASQTVVITLMLRQLPSAVAMDVQVVLQERVMMKERLHLLQERAEVHGGKGVCTVLIINGCALVSADVVAARRFFTSRSQLAHLVLSDNPIGVAGLRALRRKVEIEHGSGWWCCRNGKSGKAHAAEDSVKLDFVLSTSLPTRILEELLLLSRTIKCTALSGFELSRVGSLDIKEGDLPTVSPTPDQVVRVVQGSSVISLSGRTDTAPKPLSGLSDSETRWLFALLACSTATEWQMRDCGLAVSQWKRLADGMSANGLLTSIDLSKNTIGSEGATPIAKAISESGSLTSVNLLGNRLGEEGGKAIAEAISVSKSLTIVGRQQVR
jgi:hypothetical protein